MVIRDHLKASDLPDVCINEESRAYDLDWGNQPFDSAAKFHNLPSIDHATYLIESLKFHVGQIFHLFDEANFIHQVREFYVNPAKYAGENRIWYVQFLAVLALAKAVGTNPAKGSRTLPRSEFFTRAMSLMPDSSYLFNDALTAIEALCIIALYLQSADMRNSAYIYTGQATRMSLVFGLHRERPTDGIWSPETADRCHKVWWTVYILERTFTSTIGVPMSVHEEDITTPMPKRDGTQHDISLYIHVRISGLIFQVIRKVYGAEGRLQASFLPSVREVLTKIASIAGDLNGCFPLPSDGSGAGISRAAAHLHLVYHQAVLLTMYPLLLYLVQARLREESREPKASRTFSETTQALLKTCAESCNTMIHILSALRQEGLLECSLPFDLERIFSAAFVLKMLHFLTPRLKSYRPLRSESNLLLDDLIDRGSIPARFRKSELVSLEVMMQTWTDEGPEIVDDGPSQESERPQDTVLHSELPQLEGVETGLGEFEANFVDPNRMSPGHLLSLVEMVDVQEGATDSDMAWMDAWLWENPEELPLV
ncbi:fungal-specific transcription factor domain-containing protein [Ilyonectria robusta]|uniref:fungal-specific transcription factor domain-containing protein n=1 Tax=Ilyonectria robusta TaxID=1079257 RepID=UPI001E8EF0F9|nr:fungal-specific transcription factor domain-containing protein [Ilyonectria robusta]KAH8736362.1 fungal-specific transcription factor domain-containing protein [Ilyonectria robusta]